MVTIIRPGNRIIIPGVDVQMGRPAAAGSFVLDGISNVAAAYSASRTLRSGFTGDYIEEISSACATWYDQSGNIRNATQATASNRPGATHTIGGRTALNFDGTNDGLLTNGFTVNGPDCNAILVIKLDETSAKQTLVRLRPNGGYGLVDGFTSEVEFDKYSPNTFIDYDGDAIGMDPAGEGSPITSALILSIQWSSTGCAVYHSGVNNATGTAVRAGSSPIASFSSSWPLWIGYNFDSAGRALNGQIAEIVLIDNLLSTADHNTIGSNMASYYGLSWTTVT